MFGLLGCAFTAPGENAPKESMGQMKKVPPGASEMLKGRDRLLLPRKMKVNKSDVAAGGSCNSRSHLKLWELD